MIKLLPLFLLCSCSVCFEITVEELREDFKEVKTDFPLPYKANGPTASATS